MIIFYDMKEILVYNRKFRKYVQVKMNKLEIVSKSVI